MTAPVLPSSAPSTSVTHVLADASAELSPGIQTALIDVFLDLLKGLSPIDDALSTIDMFNIPPSLQRSVRAAAIRLGDVRNGSLGIDEWGQDVPLSESTLRIIGSRMASLRAAAAATASAGRGQELHVANAIDGPVTRLSSGWGPHPGQPSQPSRADHDRAAPGADSRELDPPSPPPGPSASAQRSTQDGIALLEQGSGQNPSADRVSYQPLGKGIALGSGEGTNAERSNTRNLVQRHDWSQRATYDAASDGDNISDNGQSHRGPLCFRATGLAMRRAAESSTATAKGPDTGVAAGPSSETGTDAESSTETSAYALQAALHDTPARAYRGPLEAEEVMRLLRADISKNGRNSLTAKPTGYLRYFHFLGPKTTDGKKERWRCRLCHLELTAPANKISNLGTHLHGVQDRAGCMAERSTCPAEPIPQPSRDADGKAIRQTYNNKRKRREPRSATSPPARRPKN
ncbi:hypothetical protein V8E36_007271 [Tilletia maclaganii]